MASIFKLACSEPDLEDRGDDDMIEAFSTSLGEKRDTAKRKRLADAPAELRGWGLSRDAFWLEENKRRRTMVQAEELRRHTLRKQQVPPQEMHALLTSNAGRNTGEERLAKDELARRKLGWKAIEFMSKAGWIGPIAACSVAGLYCTQARLLRGLRMRTLRQPVHSLEAMQRWCETTRNCSRFQKLEDVEEYVYIW